MTEKERGLIRLTAVASSSDGHGGAETGRSSASSPQSSRLEKIEHEREDPLREHTDLSASAHEYKAGDDRWPIESESWRAAPV